MIDAPTLTLEELLQLIKGPDFAIGGSIPSVTTLRAGYLSGLGKFWQRCNAEFGINGPRKTIKLHPFVSFEEVCKIVSEYAGAGLSGIVDLLEVENSPEEIILVVARDASLDLVLAKWIYRQGTGFRRLLRIDTTVFVGDSPKRLSLVQLISDFIENRISYLMDFRRLSRKDACEFMKNDLWQLRKKYAIPRHTEVRMEVGRD
jgi:topoisomerase-4 subunit A